jgi:hypothetical protein
MWELVTLAVALAAFLILIASVVKTDHVLIRVALILPILGSTLLVAVRVWSIAVILRGRDIANPS